MKPTTAIKRLRDVLDENGYRLGCQIVNDGADRSPWPNYGLVKNNVALMDGDVKALLALFYLAIPVRQEALSPSIGPETLAELAAEGIVRLNDGHVVPLKIIIPYLAYYFIVDIPPFFPSKPEGSGEVYLGVDSFLLAGKLPNLRGGSVLDLCCGSGIHAVIMAARNNRVSSVDIDPAAVHLTRLNAQLNFVEQSVTSIQGDLFAPVDGRFDLIVTKPPCQPVPDFIPRYPMAGRGGSDGLSVMRRILQDCPPHLAEGGELVTILQLLGDDRGADLGDELARYGQANGFDVTLYLSGRMPAERHVELMSGYAPDVTDQEREQWKASYAQANLTHLYDAAVIIRNTGIRHFKTVSRFFLSNDAVLASADIDQIEERIPHGMAMLDLHERFLELCDGEAPLKQIKAKLKTEFPYTAASSGDLNTQVDQFAYWLISNGLVQTEGR